MKTPSLSKQFLTVKEVAFLLGIAEKTVRKYIWLKTIPYCKINGHVRFDPARLEAWIRDRQVPTIDEIRFGNSKGHQNLLNDSSFRRDT